MEAYIATNHMVFLALVGHAQKALKCTVVLRQEHKAY